MTLGGTPAGRRLFCALALACAFAFTLQTAGRRASAQKSSRGQRAAAAPSPRPAADAPDGDYGAKIREYTTEKYFLTELVDHLPASKTVPSPDKVLGYVVGTPGKLTHTKDVHRYFRELERTSPRVKVFGAPERSEEGREQILVAVGDEAAVARLARYKEITARLADPRGLSDAEAQRLIGEGKVFYWASGAIHSPETGSPEMLMEMAYRLAVGESPFIRGIRENVVVLITPVLEVDGRDKMVDLYNYRTANPDKAVPPLVYWGKYVAHDNNRDGLGMALALTRNMMKTFLEWRPQILHDLHESVPFLYTSTGTGPYNAWLDPIVVDEWQLLAYHEIEEMTKRGVPGVWTHGFYDGWAPNYMFYVANGHNAVGRFYETFGNGGADTLDRTVGAQSQREWYRPNPPLPRVRWSLRNNVNMQQSALLFAMHFVSQNKERFLQNFYLKGKRSVAKATNEGPAAYVIPADNPRPVEVADAVNLLRLMGVEVHRARGEFSVKDQKYGAGSYVVRMDQPYSRMADMLLDTQFYNVSDPRPYDDTGWTLGAMRNIRTVRVTDRGVLQAPMTLLTADATVRGRVNGSGGVYVINHNAENTLATLRFRLKDVKMSAAEEPFKAGDSQFNAGSFVIRAEGNPPDLRRRLEAAVAELGLVAHAMDKAPAVKTHEMGVPRIAIVHSWINTQNEGWYRIEFDRYQIPYTYISDHVLRDTPSLRDRFDVIIYPPVGGSAQQVVAGLPMRGEPIPWKQSALTPNFGTSPDQTDDMRGGMGLVGLSNLQKFVEEGGLFVAVTSNARIPIDYGMVSGVAVRETPQLQARGSIFNATFSDRRSPVAYGYDATLPLYFNQTPVFQVAAGDGGGGGGAGGPGGGAQRPSGRGSLNDPDVVQGMPQAAQPTPRPSPRPGEEPPLTDEQRQQRRSPFFVPPQQRPRVILRFAQDEKNLLISGMLAGGQELANAPAVVDVPVGRGHVLLFATNPMWRHQTQGAFFLLFNAALNYDSLGVGRTADAERRAAPAAGEDEQH